MICNHKYSIIHTDIGSHGSNGTTSNTTYYIAFYCEKCLKSRGIKKKIYYEEVEE